MSSPAARAAFWTGVKDSLSFIPSFLPFALVCGVASVKAGLSTGAALAMPALVYGGSSQAVVTQLIESTDAIWVAILSGCVVNLRMAVYSAALSTHLRRYTTLQRMLVAGFLVDNTFAALEARRLSHPRSTHLVQYYAGLTITTWPSWVIFCAVGIFAGNILPAGLHLEFAVPLGFIAISTNYIRSLPAVASGWRRCR